MDIRFQNDFSEKIGVLGGQRDSQTHTGLSKSRHGNDVEKITALC